MKEFMLQFGEIYLVKKNYAGCSWTPMATSCIQPAPSANS